MKVYLGADHRGYQLKERIARWLLTWGYKFVDLGADHLDPDDDYPVYAEKVASLVADNPKSLGILLCGSGVGVDIVANKFDGIRSAIAKSPAQVKAGRKDDNFNILVLAADFTSEGQVKEIVKAFLETKYAPVARHQRRLETIKRLETNN